MDDLIEALSIFRKYTSAKWPTHCEHDVMYVFVDPDEVDIRDEERLCLLGFVRGEDWDEPCFASYRFGSA